MYNSSLRRGIRATALAFLVVAATLAGAGCGKDGGGLTDPPPSDPGPSDPGPSDPGPSDPGPSDPEPGWTGPAPVGYEMYAVDQGRSRSWWTNSRVAGRPCPAPAPVSLAPSASRWAQRPASCTRPAESRDIRMLGLALVRIS
jgi:hypothetical protein